MTNNATSPETNEAGIKPLETDSAALRLWSFIMFSFLFLGVGLWMAFARIEGAVVATGSVIVAGKPKLVQHLDGGIVAEIYVQDGDKVAAGQSLLLLDETILRSNLEIYSARLSAGTALRDRLIAEEQGLLDIKWDETELKKFDLELLDEHKIAQTKIKEARQSTRKGRINQLREKIFQFESQTLGIKSVKASKLSQKKTLVDELNGLRQLERDGYVARGRLLSLERQVQELSGQIAEHNADISRVANSVTETQIQIEQISREFSEAVLSELRESELNIADLVQQVTATREQLGRVEIVAPTSGIIHESNVFTIGGVIAPGAGVMKIISDNSEFVFEVSLEPQYVDQIFIDQKARVLFSAFNLRTTPELNGFVSRVSPNTTIQEETGFPYYTVEINIPRIELDRLQGLELVSGMPLEAFITTGKRSPLNYLMKPLTDNLRRSLREE